MANITNQDVLKELQANFADSIISADEPYGMLTIEISRDKISEVLSFLKGHAILKMQFMTDLCGIHYPNNKGKELGVIYHLHSLVNNVRLRLKCFMPDSDANIASAVSIFPTANWMERETFDFYGINFIGHPDLRRILNADEMDYHPMRKEYPLEDQTRTDKDDKFFGR